ncbi:MAG: alkaline phosphatase family protein [Acidobacteriota bacterium]|nr:alkaline phosphatase family protein [Blastocatellia bacterium]MDW8412688.1 alkaline phosphatase family protein [Acidobacteriota bacterium]
MKAAIIGLDGATFDVIEPLIAEGRLPVLRELIQNGTSGPLRSTLHPNSFPGWASCTTGTSEGMHGIFSPFVKLPGKYAFRAMTALDIRTKTVWELLSERYRSRRQGAVGVVNVPTTYPPIPVEGFLVTGMLTPTMQSQFTYPAELQKKLLTAVSDYRIEPRRNTDKQSKAVEFRNCMLAHSRAVEYLLKTASSLPDFLMVVYSVLDRTQHDFWEDFDPQHHRHDPKSAFKDFIPQMYELIDASVGRLLQLLPPTTTVLICSDHGFCASLYEVRVNEWLRANGYLRYHSGYTFKVRSKISSLRTRLQGSLSSPSNGWDNALEKKAERGRAVFEEIDWKHTRVFFGQDRGLWLNIKGREAEGICEASDIPKLLDELRDGLLKLTSPIDGLPIFEQVLTREEAFSGRYACLLPDLIPIIRDPRFVPLEGRSSSGVIIPSSTTSGAHAPYGIFIAYGDSINRRKRIEGAHLRDVAATALFAMNEPITEDMDGRALIEIFTSEALSARQLVRQGSSYKDSCDDGDHHEDDEEIRERMRALGYIG